MEIKQVTRILEMISSCDEEMVEFGLVLAEELVGIRTRKDLLFALGASNTTYTREAVRNELLSDLRLRLWKIVKDLKQEEKWKSTIRS